MVPQIGTGTVVVLVLLGQIISSLNIDQFGL
ncbi:DMT family transporter [Pediococcus pentosaceus]